MLDRSSELPLRRIKVYINKLCKLFRQRNRPAVPGEIPGLPVLLVLEVFNFLMRFRPGDQEALFVSSAAAVSAAVVSAAAVSAAVVS
jgi:hypothetical protein